MGYATGLLEYSDDPLSDTTPSWDVRSSYVLGDVTWSDGKSRDLDDPQAGSISFRLKSPNGEWVPNSPDSLYPDSPFILRRFRWSVNGTAEGIWVPVAWQTTYPADTSYAVIEVTCVDQVFALLSLDNLDLLDPPAATTYEEVVMHDQPFAFYTGNDVDGTILKAETGPDMVIIGRPLVQQPSLVTGDPGFSIRMGTTPATVNTAKVAIQAGQFGDTNKISVGGWFKPVATGVERFLLYGPKVASTDDAFTLRQTSGDKWMFRVHSAAGVPATATGTTTVSTGRADCVFGTWDGQTARLYVNGTLEAQETVPLTIGTGTSDLFISINDRSGTGTPSFYWQKAEFHETCLSPERVLARWTAGSEGFPDQLAGERVAAVAESDLWAETEIQAGSHTVQGTLPRGQSKLDEIRAAAKAEMPESHFFGNGDGDPTYLGWNYNDGNGPLATFGPGGIGYQGIEPVYDDEMFNEVTVGHEAAPGEETQHAVTDTDSVSEFRRRAHAETGLILTEHHDAIAVATAILSKFSRPQQRFASLTINGTETAARTQILARQIGDLIRVKGIGVNDSDIVTTILGRSKTLTAAGHLTCTWTLARGFDAAAGVWQLGVDGFSELNQTAVLA